MQEKISWLKLAAFVIASELAGILGSIFTIQSIPAWYSRINKPDFSPPNWIFGPVWTLLYALQGAAAYLVYEQRENHPQARAALKLFWFQLALNTLWTPLFFGLKNPGLAFFEIVLLWIAIVLTTVWFFKVKKASGWLMLPYLVWVSFASVLNFAVWRLNP